MKGIWPLMTVLLAAGWGYGEELDLAPQAQSPATPFDHSHSAWAEVLEAHVKDGRVDYAALKKDPSNLNTYLADLESVSKEAFDEWSKRKKLAFWVNAYNAYTVKLIVDNYPVKSIKDLGGFFSSVFNKKFIPLRRLFGGVVSLNTIEHKTLRAKFKEPRIHFALVCASRGCPPLRSEAFRADDLDAQLDGQAKIFLSNPAHNRFDAKTGTLHLSKIFRWFEEDFEKTAGSVPKFLSQYLDLPEDVRIKYLPYDWSLNKK